MNRIRDRMFVSTSPVFLEHDPGRHHPESPARLRALLELLQDDPPVSIDWSEPAEAPLESAATVHTDGYLALLDRLRGKRARLDADTTVSERSIEAACRAMAASTDTVDALLGGRYCTALALVRPPGHHAERDHAMGFCLLSNIAIAAEHARTKHGVERTLIVDWDVHHGNGTQHAFEERDDVLFFSIHRGFGFYPGTGGIGERGRGRGAGYTVNVPLPAGSGDSLYAALFERLLHPIADAFQPELVLVSAGYDAHQRDPLGGMMLSSQAFGTMARAVRSIADRWAGGRLGLVLEGGYDLLALRDGLARTVAAAVAAAPPAPAPALGPSEQQILDRILEAHRQAGTSRAAGDGT